MKRIILFTCATLLIANFLFGLLLSSYEWLNVLFSSGIIVLSGIFMLLISVLSLKDGNGLPHCNGIPHTVHSNHSYNDLRQ